MSVNFNAALSAYNKAANITSDANAASSTSGADSSGDVSFASIIGSNLHGAASTLRATESTVTKSLVKQADITDVVTAISSAEVTLRTVMRVRDKLVDAHMEIMRMPI